MKRPESKNSEINVYISAKELKVGHKFSPESSPRQTEVRNMISYKIIIMHKIKTYQLFQKNTHFRNLKPAQYSPSVTHRGDTEQLLGISPLQDIENSTLWLSHHAQLGIHAKTQFNKCSSKGLPNHTLHAQSSVLPDFIQGYIFLCYLADWVDCSRQSFFIFSKNKFLLRVGSPRLHSLPVPWSVEISYG